MISLHFVKMILWYHKPFSRKDGDLTIFGPKGVTLYLFGDHKLYFLYESFELLLKPKSTYRIAMSKKINEWIT